jgi:hypothetical protein
LIFENDFLQQCERASQRGFPLFDDVGCLVGRGYADIGYEVFVMLPSGQLLSLLTGQTSRFAAEDREHFFSVPDLDTVVRVLEEAGCSIESSIRLEQRTWSVQIRSGDGRTVEALADNLHLAMMMAIHDGILIQNEC